MPGLVIASRRWIIGSDDFIIPGSLLFVTHFIWLTIYIVLCAKNGTFLLDVNCSTQLTYHLFGQSLLIFGCAILEICIIKVSFKGSILDIKARSSLGYLVYIRIALFVLQVIWESYGLAIYLSYSIPCSYSVKQIIIGLKIFDLLIVVNLILIIWCAFDSAGRSWVKMKKFQKSLNDENSKYKYRRSKNSYRNWRHREAVREYEKSWDKRCRKFCCILTLKDGRENSFTEVAKLLSEFFRDLDVVPSDVIAGLSLIRVQQKSMRKEKINNIENKIFQFLSGVPISDETNFLDLTHSLVVKEVHNLIHYLQYSMAIYGWPMYMMANPPTNWCKLLNHTKCCGNSSGTFANCYGFSFQSHLEPDTIVDESYLYNLKDSNYILGDNCCLCNRAAIEQTCIDHNYKIIYITYQVAVEKPPFFVAIDYDQRSIVISIRGTLSLYDVLTDLNAEYDILPLNPPKESWFGHKGMVSAASYIRKRLIDKQIFERANEELKANDVNPCDNYPIIVVGHSLGAGTAAILSILLRETYQNVICFAFAPPGGLLSEDVAEYSKDFIVSVVLGKDIVPRLGLHQMEKLRFDLIKAIKQCNMSKWSIIFKSCCIGRKELSMQDFVREFKMEKQNNKSRISADEEIKNLSINPNDESISMTVHTPLYPPGSIIHLVKKYPNKDEQIISKKHPIIQALWANNQDFNEILISPTMIKDHMPDRMLDALKCLLTTTGPPKPQRLESDSPNMLNNNQSNTSSSSNDSDITKPNIVVETSFTDSYKAANKAELYDKDRLLKIRNLIRKGKAPLATPDSDSLASLTDTNSDIIDKLPKRSSVAVHLPEVRNKPNSVQTVIEITKETTPFRNQVDDEPISDEIMSQMIKVYDSYSSIAYDNKETPHSNSMLQETNRSEGIVSTTLNCD